MEFWEKANKALTPDDSSINAQKAEIAEMAKVDLLKPLNDALMIKRLATTFNLDPDLIYEKSGEWVLLWSYAGKMEGEYQERYQEIQRQLNDKPKHSET